MRIALCDDDEAQREKLKAAVDRHLVSRGYRPRYEEYSGGGPLVAEVAAGTDPFDLVFLDVYLEGDDGIAVARKLREHDPSVPLVFLTVSREHAVESYEVQATSYLVKPAEPRMAFRVGSARRYFDYRNIAYLESRDHAVLLHQADGSCHRSLAKLDDVADELSDPRFLRCHRSFIVNMDFIVDVRDDFILRDGTCVPVRVKERRKMHEAYYRYFTDALCAG